MAEELSMYAYLNIENPMVAWEVAIGRIYSAGASTRDRFGISVWQFNMMKRSALRGHVPSISAEFGIESFRQQYFPGEASRLKGIFFFESADMARAAIKRWGMPSRYNKYISKVRFWAENYSKYDSEWFTQHASSGRIDWYRDYLSGKTLGENPLTEIVADGFGLILNQDLRRMAVQRVLELWPTSSILLAAAMCAINDLNLHDVALTTPYLYCENGRIGGHHAIKMDVLERHQLEISKAIERNYANGNINIPLILPNNPDMLFSVPDMRDQKFVIDLPQAIEQFESVHHSSHHSR